jgi:hypothetical protein
MLVKLTPAGHHSRHEATGDLNLIIQLCFEAKVFKAMLISLYKLPFLAQ